MANSVIKFKDEEKWLGAESVSCNAISEILVNEKVMQEYGFSPEQIDKVMQAIAFQKENKVSGHSVL